MQNTTDYLAQLGLTKNEISAYTKLLETGPLPVQKLAQLLHINRTSMYVYVDELIEKGVITKIVQGTQSQVESVPPHEVLQKLLEEKEQATKNLKEQLPTMAQAFLTAFPEVKQSSDAEIRYYKGRQGVKKIYEEVLKSKEIRSYVNIEDVLSTFPENRKLFDNAFNNNLTMKMFEIVEDSPKARERFGITFKRDRYSYKFLPKRMNLKAQDILIYDGNVSFINLKNNITGVVLRNIDLYNNFKLLFDFIWEVLPEVVHDKK